MAERPSRKARTINEAQVVRTERLTPHMVRIVLGGESLAGFGTGEHTDHYIKILFPAQGVSYPEPFDMERIRAEFPREQWPSTRAYTVRNWDAAAGELTVDFVVHGDEGLAGPWATRVQVARRCASSAPAEGTPRTRRPTGTCSSVTRARCPRSRRRWSACRRAPWCTPSSK